MHILSYITLNTMAGVVAKEYENNVDFDDIFMVRCTRSVCRPFRRNYYVIDLIQTNLSQCTRPIKTIQQEKLNLVYIRYRIVLFFLHMIASSVLCHSDRKRHANNIGGNYIYVDNRKVEGRVKKKIKCGSFDQKTNNSRYVHYLYL